MDHLGAEPHDQQQRFRGRIAEDFVTNVDAVGAGDLRRLMGEPRACLPSSDTVLSNYGTVSRTAEDFAVVDRPAATVWYGPNTSEAWQALVTFRERAQWPTKATILP
jgi:hypothetical protein